jgi:hypothetical protein
MIYHPQNHVLNRDTYKKRKNLQPARLCFDTDLCHLQDGRGVATSLGLLDSETKLQAGIYTLLLPIISFSVTPPFGLVMLFCIDP